MCMEALLERIINKAPAKRKPGAPPNYLQDKNGKPIHISADDIRIFTPGFDADHDSPAAWTPPSELLQLPHHILFKELPHYVLLKVSEYLGHDKAASAVLGLPDPNVKHDTTDTKHKKAASEPTLTAGGSRTGAGRPRLYPRDENGKPIRHNPDGSRIAEKPKYNSSKRRRLAKMRRSKKREATPDSDSEG